MTLVSISLACNCNNVTLFRAWGSAVSAALATVGMVQTADTGQINWATVALPGAPNTSGGYEIWRFADSLQASAPIYFKLEYGIGAGSSLTGLWLTVGIGSDGAGNLTGVKVARLEISGAAAGAGAANPCFVSGDSGRVTIALKTSNDGVATTTSFLLASIERSYSTGGTTTGDGMFVLMFSAGGGPAGIAKGYAVDFTNAYVAPVRNYAPSLLPDGATWQVGPNVGVAPVIPVGLGDWNPSPNMASFLVTDIVNANVITLSPYGTNRSFIAFTDVTSGIHSNTSGRLLVRYD